MKHCRLSVAIDCCCCPCCRWLTIVANVGKGVALHVCVCVMLVVVVDMVWAAGMVAMVAAIIVVSSRVVLFRILF